MEVEITIMQGKGNAAQAFDIWPFVGREAQVGAFLRAINEAKYNAFIIKGESGVGKTRLAKECLEQAFSIGHAGGRTAFHAPNGSPSKTLMHALPREFDRMNPTDHSWRAREKKATHSPHKKQHKRFIILVDGLQFIDTASAIWISQLMDAGIVFLLATLQSDTGMSKVVSSLVGADSAWRVEIADFSLPETERLMENTLDGLVAPCVSTALQRLSGGRVSYLRDLTMETLRTGSLKYSNEMWFLGGPLKATRELRELFNTSFSAITKEARELLELISLRESIEAREFPLETACELETADLVKSINSGNREFLTMAHPLYSAVLTEGLSESKKKYLLSKHATRTRIRGARRRLDVLNITLGELKKDGKADPSILKSALQVARGERDFSSSRLLASAAFRSSSDFQSCLLLGEALHESGETREADRILQTAETLASTHNQHLEVLIMRTRNLAWGLGDSNLALELFSRTSGQHQTDVSLNSSKVLTMMSSGLKTPAPSEVMQVPLQKDDSTLLECLAQTWGLAIRGRSLEAMQLGGAAYAACTDVAIDRSIKMPDATHFLPPLIVASEEIGELERAYNFGLQEWNEISGLSLHCSKMLLSLSISRCAIRRGLPLIARRWAGQAAAMARQSASKGQLYAAVHLVAEAALLMGDLESAERALSEARMLPEWGVFIFECAIPKAWYAAAHGDLPQAISTLLKGAADARRAENFASEGRILTELGRLGQFELAKNRLNEQVPGGEFVSLCARYFAARADGNPEAIFDCAHALEHAGALLLAAEAASSAASAWRRRRHVREATAAGNKAAALAKMCEGSQTPDLVAVPVSIQLTKREREIAFLVAKRLTNSEIANQANISRRTVENHLQNIYRKIGVATRGELRSQLEGDSS
ncbi:LuxR C-terminal-related transcriptional regulator [Streptomyces sp. NPDC058685]|uniref:LuxR C-terminal-related transcriptional regulator n=1 Tax=Streptomyces sp. NPDC058685 TaxID=3346598 RepID=UPI00366650E3